MRTLASQLRALAPADTPAAPRIYADANVPAGAVALTRRELGWDVLFVLEHEMLRRASDREHYVRALDLGRTLVTLDRDFADPERFPPAIGPGVIICSAPDEVVLVRLLRYVDRALLRASPGGVPPGRTVVITPDTLSDRPSPPA